MIPKVIVWRGNDRKKLLDRLEIRNEELIAVDGDTIPIDEFRHWINQSIGMALSRPHYKLMVWLADSLSFESQAVLLKPLEELDQNLKFYLIVNNENGLMPTILSRCVVEIHQSDEVSDLNGYWEKVMDCWKNGPSSCIELSETMNKETAAEMAEEVLQKLKNNLTTGISEKRLAVLEETLKLIEDIKQRNINIKLAVGDYLIRTQKLVKT